MKSSCFRLSRHGKLWEADDVGALVAGAADPVDHQPGIAGQVADGRVDLCQRDSQDPLHTIHFGLRASLRLRG
jgi:hypothetical protein